MKHLRQALGHGGNDNADVSKVVAMCWIVSFANSGNERVTGQVFGVDVGDLLW